MRLFLLFFMIIPLLSFSQNLKPPTINYYKVDTLSLSPESKTQLNNLIDEGILTPVTPGNLDPKILAPYIEGNIDEDIWLEKKNGKMKLYLNDSTEIIIGKVKIVNTKDKKKSDEQQISPQ